MADAVPLDRLKKCTDETGAVISTAEHCQSKSLFSRLYSSIASIATMATTQTASAPVMPGGLDSKKGPGAVPSGQAAPKAVPVRSRMPGAGQFDAGTADTLERIARGPVEPMPLSHYALMKRNEYLLQNISQRRLGEMDFNAPDPNKPQAKPKPTLKPLAHSF